MKNGTVGLLGDCVLLILGLWLVNHSARGSEAHKGCFNPSFWLAVLGWWVNESGAVRTRLSGFLLFFYFNVTLTS